MSARLPVLWMAFAIGVAATSSMGVKGLGQERSALLHDRMAAIVGHWESLVEDGKPVFLLDARRWKRDSADGAFPVAVADEPRDFGDGTLRVRIKLIAGTSDHSAGLVFGHRPSGEYLFVRYNTREGNVALWQFANGARKVVARGTQRAQLPLGVWHEIVVRVSGTGIVGTVNDTLRVEHTLTAPVSGRVGFWGKHDAVSAFSELRVEPR